MTTTGIQYCTPYEDWTPLRMGRMPSLVREADLVRLTDIRGVFM
ncbi:hypothetical protein ACIQMV_17965 [Streptomyces sp. NPDC091412]